MRLYIVVYYLCFLFLSGIICGCKSQVQGELKAGTWRGVLALQGQELPFNFEVSDTGRVKRIFLLNAGERLELDSFHIVEDSIIIPMHLFDSKIVAKLDGEKMKGLFIKNFAQDYKLSFQAEWNNKKRFNQKEKVKVVLPERYKVQFSDKPDSIYGVALFTQIADKVTGAVMTITGDHRYLEGNLSGDSLFLSTFDGEHAYLYKAKVNSDSSLSGRWFSGRSYNTTFNAWPDRHIELPKSTELTFLKPGYDKISFSFPAVEGGNLSPENAKFKDKVLILQVLGTWCPNCMDETKFLASWYQKNKHKDVEIIGIGYEKKDDLAYARERLKKMQDRLKVDYPLVVGGSSENAGVRKSLPMINGVIAFPTTIFVDKEGRVRKIHTGFTGPGTGRYYEAFVDEFNATVDKLLSE